MTPLRACGSAVIATALASCLQADGGAGTTLVDSAGVTLAVAESPLWQSGEGWRVSDEPLLQIGVLEGAEAYLFSDLVGVVRLDDGRIVAADRGSADLRFYDPDGGLLLRVGSEGEGPGEFRRLDFIGRLPGDSLVTYDSSLRRIQFFDPQGVFVRSIRVESPWPTAFPDMVIGVVDSSRVAMEFGGYGTEVPDGIVRWPPELVATMDLRTGALDSLRVVPGPEASVVDRGGGGYSHGTVLFGKGNEFAAAAGRIAVISTDTFAVHLMGTGGATRQIIRRPILPEPAGPEDVEEWIRNATSLVFPPGSEASPEDVINFRREWERAPRSSTLPLLRSVHLDLEGIVWVETYVHLGAPPAPFQVFSPEGTWLGAVALPPGQDRGVHPRRAPSFQIGADFILGVWRDVMDVQYIRLYGLNKG